MTKKHIFVLDDQQNSTGVFGEIREELCIKFSFFTSVIECFRHLRAQKCDLLVVDLKIPDADTIALIKNVKRSLPWVAVLAIADSGDIPNAVEAIKAGAADVIDGPPNKNNFLKKIKSIFQKKNTDLGELLSQKEIEVLRFILDGKSNKETACLIHRSTRTVEVHRRHIMQKLGVNNTIDLIKQASSIGLLEFPNNHNNHDL